MQRSVSGDDRTDLRFFRLCRLRKESLTNRDRCEFSAYLPGGVRFKHVLERSTFEGLISHHVEETVRLTRSVVEEARENGHPVETVVLIGGSSRVPLVRQLLLKDANLPAEPQRWQQQDVAVALGAAYQGQSLWRDRGKQTQSHFRAGGASGPRGLPGVFDTGFSQGPPLLRVRVSLSAKTKRVRPLSGLWVEPAPQDLTCRNCGYPFEQKQNERAPCPDCGVKPSPKDLTCRHCGYPLKAKRS